MPDPTPDPTPAPGPAPSPTPSPDPSPKPDDGRTFSQADVDRIIAGRLSKYADYDEIKQQVSDLVPLREQFAEVAKVFGVKADDGKTDVLASVQQQLAQMQRDNVVLALANEHGITDKADLELLKNSALDGEALAAMAQRLKPAAPSGLPQPDPSQGPNGKPPVDPGPGVARLRHAYANPST